MVRERAPGDPAEEQETGRVTTGNRGEVWDSAACRGAGDLSAEASSNAEADRRKAANASAAKDGEGDSSAEASAKAEGDMFTRAGVAAE
jgi:hypothetical protein